ncbi:MAG: SpoIIE family protein phosphatase [Oscillospiraceae bacterium]|nr:SpoIIE family protein phosphatase [Oscillospiraceae bacterium]
MLKTVHAKLLIPILCSLILGSLIMGVLSHRAASNVVIDAFMEDGLRSAENLRENIDMVISKAQLDLAALSVAPSVKHLLLGDEASEELVEGYIMALVEQHSIYNSITVLNEDGVIVASTSGSTGQERADREYFQESMKGNFFISEVEISRQTERLVTFLSIPVINADDGTIIGVALTVIRLDELNDHYVVPVSLLSNHGHAMISNGSGTIIGHRTEEIIGDDMPEETVEQLLLITEGGGKLDFEITRDGIRYMAFAERSHYTDWFAVVVCPVNEFYKATNYLAVYNTILAVLLIILQACIIWLVVRGITKALSATVKYSEAVSKGALDTSLTIEREDEVGVLAQSLRVMVGKLKTMIEEAEKTAETIMESINYASKIQKNLLPTNSVLDEAFSDYSVIWKPRDVVGGDIYWAKNFDDGTVLCVCDCTGHGTPGALLTMLVVSAFETAVTDKRHNDTAQILYDLDRRLAYVLHVERSGDLSMNVNDGCDLAVLFIAKDGSITMSAGNTNVFVCDGNEVKRYKGQSVYVGEGRLKGKDEVIVHNIPSNPDNKYYIASDGMSDQIGGDRGKQYGFKEFERIVLENHNEKQADISGKIWDAFQEHQGEQPRRDDFQLVTFKP